MSAMIATGVFVGAGQDRSVPQQLGAILYIPDFNTPVNGYWQDKSGKGKLVQAATTTVANDSLIMPANDADIIAALTLAGAYSKYYTNNSTPKKVLVSQVASIDSKYAVFFDAKTKTKFSLFKTQGDESRADKMYEFTFKAYTGGYFPITQTSDSVSFVIRGTGTHVFDWGDGTTTSYTLTIGADTTISKTWTTNLGGQKNISVTGSGTVKTWSKLDTYSFNYNECFRISGMNLNYLRFHSNTTIRVCGSVSYMPLTYLLLYQLNSAYIGGDTTFSPLTFLQISLCPYVDIKGDVSGKSINFLMLNSSPLIELTGSINGMLLTGFQINTCPKSKFTGNIENCQVNSTTISVLRSGIVYGGGICKAWTCNITIQSGWSTLMVDAFLNAFALVAPTVTSKTLNLAGTNQPRSSVSDSAVATIQSRGFSIVTSTLKIANILVDGDSQCTSQGATTLWPTILKNYIGGVNNNVAVGGQWTTNLLSNLQSHLDTYYNDEYSNNILVILIGVNNISHAVPISDVVSDIEIAVQLGKTKGFDVFVLTQRTCLDDSYFSIFQNFRQQLINSALINNFKIIDWFNDSNWNFQSAYQNMTYYQPDFIHLTDQSHLQTALIVKDAILSEI